MRRRLSCFFLLLTLLAALQPSASAQEQTAARVTVTPGALIWSPQVAADLWLLTFSGRGVFLKETFDGGATPAVSAALPDGLGLADGIYMWELRPVRLDELEDEEPAGTDAEEHSGGLYVERRSECRPLVASGLVRVEARSFVAPSVEDDEEGGPES